MDMPTPTGLATEHDTPHVATLARLAQALGCTPDRFLNEARADTEKDTTQLIQMWLAIRSPAGREAVFAFVSKILRSETADGHQGIDV